MHPSRLVALGFLTVSVLLGAQVGLGGGVRLTASTVFLLFGGVFLLCASLYGLVRYEANPIVTEYGPTTYLLLFALGLQAAGLLARLLSA